MHFDTVRLFAIGTLGSFATVLVLGDEPIPSLILVPQPLAFEMPALPPGLSNNDDPTPDSTPATSPRLASYANTSSVIMNLHLADGRVVKG
jgi:hypothetical protein